MKNKISIQTLADMSLIFSKIVRLDSGWNMCVSLQPNLTKPNADESAQHHGGLCVGSCS